MPLSRVSRFHLSLLAALAIFTSACGGGGGGSSSAPPLPGPPPAGISGTITSADNTAVDGDTNDPFSPWNPNDSQATSQPIVAPVSVGGFACADPTGNIGDRFRSVADPADVYRAELLSGQTVSLQVSDHPGGDSAAPNLDLILHEANSAVEVVASRSTSGTERLTVPADGSYDVVVAAVAGASNYQLTIGSAGLAGAQGRPEFVPGEVLVRFADARGPGVAHAAARAARSGLRTLGGGPGRVVRLSLPAESADRRIALDALGVQRAGRLPPGVDDATALRLETELAVKALRRQPDVRSADLNYVHQPTAVPDDTHLQLQWHYSQIGLAQAWDFETGGSNPVTVAVVDTGVLLGHPDLAGKLVQGYDFISDAFRGNDGNGIDGDPNDPGDDQTPGGSSFHGTHVAGTIAAATDNGMGVAGCSWGASLMPIRVLGQGGGTSFDIIQGIRYAAGLDNVSGTVPAVPADVINLSLGCSGCFSATEEAAYAAVRDAGVILVAAAGNESSAVPHYPAAYQGVVSVSALDRFRQRAYYSNFGATVDVAAPGGDTSRDADGNGYPDGVLSTLGDDSAGSIEFLYGFYQGTSMAAPHVAGVVALMKSANPGFVTPDQFDALLETGALTEDLGLAGRDDVYGHGLIDAHRAVLVAGSGVVPTTLSIAPGTLFFGPGDLSASLILDQGSGAGSLVIDSVGSEASWLSVTGSGLGLYDVTVDRTGLVDGTYPGAITVDYRVDGSPARKSVPVIVRVGAGASSGGNTGYTYMVLIDSVTNEPLYFDRDRNRAGSYVYGFPEISPGNYVLVAGSDSDNDGFICDAGESCGAFPTLDLLQPVQVIEGEDRTGVDFIAGYAVSLTSAGAGAGGPEVPPAGFARLPRSVPQAEE